MKLPTKRLAPLSLCLPLSGILFGFLLAKTLASSGIPPIGAGVYGIIAFSACSILGFLFAIAEVRILHRMDGLSIAAILINGLFIIPGLWVLIAILFSK